MNGSYYAVPVQIGGRDRSLVCNMKALSDIKKATGKNPLQDPSFIVPDPDSVVQILVILLRKTEPDITAESLADEMDACSLVPVLEAIGQVVAGPNAKAGAAADNPPQASA